MDSRHKEDPDTLPWKVSFQNATGQDKTLAAFRLESSYLQFLARCYQATAADVLKDLAERARRSTVTIEEAGIEGDVLQEKGRLPYDKLLVALKEAIVEVEMLKAHQHEYVVPENGSMSYCRICTRSGDI